MTDLQGLLHSEMSRIYPRPTITVDLLEFLKDRDWNIVNGRDPDLEGYILEKDRGSSIFVRLDWHKNEILKRTNPVTGELVHDAAALQREHEFLVLCRYAELSGITNEEAVREFIEYASQGRHKLPVKRSDLPVQVGSEGEVGK